MSTVNCLKRGHSDEPSAGSSCNHLSVKDFKMHEVNLNFKESEIALEKEKNNRKLSRNESEKLRRDRLNMYIVELAKLVPLVTNVNKKIDKSTILRLAVNYLRIHHDLVKRNTQKFQWRPKFLSNGNLGGSLLESLDSFLFVVSQKGIVNYVSESITDILGHSQVDLLGHSVFNLIHHEDQELLKNILLTKEGENPDSEEGHYRSFDVRILNICSKQQVSRYDTIRIVGRLKRMPRPYEECNQRINLELPKPEVCLVAVGKLICHESLQNKELAWKDPCYTQWITQHTLDGKILYSDQRGSWLTGYFSKESQGLSPYDLMHPQDVQTVVKYHGLLLKDGEIPSLIFRMYTKDGDTLYICSTSHMVVDMWTGNAKSIISLQVLLKPDEGKRKLKEQLEKIAALEAAANNLAISDKMDSPDTSQVFDSEASLSNSPVEIIDKDLSPTSVVLDSSDGDIDSIAGKMLEIQTSRKSNGIVSPNTNNHISTSRECMTMNNVSQDSTGIAQHIYTNGYTSDSVNVPYSKLRKVVTTATPAPSSVKCDTRTMNSHQTAGTNQAIDSRDNVPVTISTKSAAPSVNSTKLAALLSKPVELAESPGAPEVTRLNEGFVSPCWYKDSSSSASSCSTSSASYQDDVFSQASENSPEMTLSYQENDSGNTYNNAFFSKVQQSLPKKSSVQNHIEKLRELQVKRQEHEKALQKLEMEYKDQVRLLTELNPEDVMPSPPDVTSTRLSIPSTASSSELSLSPRQSPSSTLMLSPVPKVSEVSKVSDVSKVNHPIQNGGSQSAVSSYPLLHNLLSNGTKPPAYKKNEISEYNEYNGGSDNSNYEVTIVSSTSKNQEFPVNSLCSNGSFENSDSLSDNELWQSIINRSDIDMDLSSLSDVSNTSNKFVEDDLRLTNVISSAEHLFNIDVNSFDFDIQY